MVPNEELTNGNPADGAPENNVAVANGDGTKKELSAEDQHKVDVEGKIFLGGLTWQTTDDMLKAHFSKWGPLNDVILMRNKMTGEPRGFGFVQFTDTAAADAALKEEHVIDGRTIDVKRAVPRDRAPQPRATSDRQSQGYNGAPRAQVGDRHGGMNDAPLSNKIFVGGLDQEVNDADFRAYFSTFGKVEDAVVMYDKKTSRSRGFGFITYDSPDTVRKVMNGGTHELKGKPVEVKPASPRDGPRPGGYNAGGGYGGGYGGGGQGWSQQGYGHRGGYQSGGYQSGGYGNRGGSYGGGQSAGYGAGNDRYGGGGGGYGQGSDRQANSQYAYGGQQSYGYGYGGYNGQQTGYGYGGQQASYSQGSPGYTQQGYGQGQQASASRQAPGTNAYSQQNAGTAQGYGAQTASYSQGYNQQSYAAGGQTAVAGVGGYGGTYDGADAVGGYGASTAATGYGTAAADQGGYGAYRGGAASTGRQDRSYRPY